MASFEIVGPATPESPVVLSVPHAGRDYPTSLLGMLRVPAAALAGLEDRHVDAVARGARRGETMVIAHRPRAWIDLNRAESERDPRAETDVQPGVVLSAKVRSGLGLVPRRSGNAGDLWRRRFASDDIDMRILLDHRPYHAAIASALAAARARFGTAVLLDLHSMPRLPGGAPAQVVIGDRFGRAAAARFVHRVEAEIEAAGVRQALNTPYAGGHILDRHARPAGGIHAIQLELDRGLYLDVQGDTPGPGLGATVALVRRLIDALADEAFAVPGALAAE